jgi:hypothetical protein
MTDVPRPRGICGSCYQTAVAAIAGALTGEHAGYCQHRQCGALFQPALCRWITFEPISLEDFLRKVSTPHAIAVPIGRRGAHD